jgi:hypothetical protein
MERSYDLKRACTAALRDVLSGVHAARGARQHETVKASIPSMGQLKGSIPRHAPWECLFSGPRSRSVYLNTTRQTLHPGYALCLSLTPPASDAQGPAPASSVAVSGVVSGRPPVQQGPVLFYVGVAAAGPGASV